VRPGTVEVSSRLVEERVVAVETVTSAAHLLGRLAVDPASIREGDLVIRTPITGEEIGRVARTDAAATDAAVARAAEAFALCEVSTAAW
jgi:aldehyde dehydrogenase (NAD+)